MKLIDQSVNIFSKDLTPLYRAQPGETMVFRTLDCFGNQIRREDQLVHTIDPEVANPAAGPVYVEGAQPGDVLVVDILDIQVDSQGVICTMEEAGPLSDDCEIRTKVVPIENGMASFKDIKWQVDPMIGVIGVAPAEGAIPCELPGAHGGNMDSKMIKKGSRVYLPVFVEGALLGMGDIHASMGDCELCGTGIEIAGDITVRVSLIKDFKLAWPVTETKEKWYVNPCADDYEKALILGSKEMQRLLVNAYGWDKTDVFLYMSVQCDVEINQATKPCPIDMILRIGVPKLAEKPPLIR